MNEPKVKIILKKEYDKPREITVGTKTVKAEPGKPFDVLLKDLEIWLKTGKFDRVDEPTTPASDLPAEIPGRAALVKKGISFEVVSTMTIHDLTAIPNIAEKTAEEILKFLGAEKGGQQ